jgi:hypothetical protein
MAVRAFRAILRTRRRPEMETLWTTVAYALVGGGALLAAYILFRWFDAARRR